MIFTPGEILKGQHQLQEERSREKVEVITREFTDNSWSTVANVPDHYGSDIPLEIKGHAQWYVEFQILQELMRRYYYYNNITWIKKSL